MGIVDPFSVARAAGLELTGKSEGLTLTDGSMELRADFTRMLPRLKQGRLQQELLVKAARTKGIESPWAIDATAGFGEDSLLLAAAGFTVDLYEQDCVIAALLQDALDRAADDSALATAVARMRLHAGEDSIAGLRHTAELIEQGVEVHAATLAGETFLKARDATVAALFLEQLGARGTAQRRLAALGRKVERRAGVQIQRPAHGLGVDERLGMWWREPRSGHVSF